MTFDIWFCRIFGLAAVLAGTFDDVGYAAEFPRGHHYLVGLILICTAMVLGHLRERLPKADREAS